MSIFNDQLSLQEKQLSSFTEHLEKGGSLLGVEVKQDSFKFNPKLSFTKKISKCALAILNTLISPARGSPT